MKESMTSRGTFANSQAYLLFKHYTSRIMLPILHPVRIEIKTGKEQPASTVAFVLFSKRVEQSYHIHYKNCTTPPLSSPISSVTKDSNRHENRTKPFLRIFHYSVWYGFLPHRKVDARELCDIRS